MRGGDYALDAGLPRFIEPSNIFSAQSRQKGQLGAYLLQQPGQAAAWDRLEPHLGVLSSRFGPAILFPFGGLLLGLVMLFGMSQRALREL
jgi:hypothetical protein